MGVRGLPSGLPNQYTGQRYFPKSGLPTKPMGPFDPTGTKRLPYGESNVSPQPCSSTADKKVTDANETSENKDK